MMLVIRMTRYRLSESQEGACAGCKQEVCRLKKIKPNIEEV